MNTSIERVLLQTLPLTPENIRAIEHDYHVCMIAEDSTQLKRYQVECLRLQTKAALSHMMGSANEGGVQSGTWTYHISDVEERDRLARGIGRLTDGMHRLNSSLNALNETAAAIVESIEILSDTVTEGFATLAEIAISQKAVLNEISTKLGSPYEAQTLELRSEAAKWLVSGMKNTGRDRSEDWRDALRLLKSTTENQIGMQDPVVWFQLGWLLWKLENDITGAESAFYRAQRLSASNQDLYHRISLRHLAYMEYLQSKPADAYQTMQKALVIKRNHPELYDSARYAAVSGQEATALDLLERCITIRPQTIVTMMAEPDFKGMLSSLVPLAVRKTDQARKKARTAIEQCEAFVLLTDRVSQAAPQPLEVPTDLTKALPKLDSQLVHADLFEAISVYKSAKELRQSGMEIVRGALTSEITRREKALANVSNQVLEAKKAHRIKSEDLKEKQQNDTEKLKRSHNNEINLVVRELETEASRKMREVLLAARREALMKCYAWAVKPKLFSRMTEAQEGILRRIEEGEVPDLGPLIREGKISVHLSLGYTNIEREAKKHFAPLISQYGQNQLTGSDLFSMKNGRAYPGYRDRSAEQQSPVYLRVQRELATAIEKVSLEYKARHCQQLEQLKEQYNHALQLIDEEHASALNTLEEVRGKAKEQLDKAIAALKMHESAAIG